MANLICRGLDSDLTYLAGRHSALYTRYADDITFSFPRFSRLGGLLSSSLTEGTWIGFLGELEKIFHKHNFNINNSKTRLRQKSQRLEVTGLTINKFPNVKRDFIDKIRGALHSWEKHGYLLANTTWTTTAVAKAGTDRWHKQWQSRQIPELKNILRGKLLYLCMVRGKEDRIYNRLANLYNTLCKREGEINSSFLATRLPVDKVVRHKDDAQAATYVVEWSADYIDPIRGTHVEAATHQGTAFSYSGIGLITCNHLFYHTPGNGDPEVDFSSKSLINKDLKIISSATKQAYSATLVKRDSVRDIALLQIENSDSFNERKHFVGRQTPIQINDTGTLIGYPNYNPSRSLANMLDVEVLNRFVRTGLTRVEINGNIRKGNSGGPLVDDQFKVAGIAQQGSTQSSGNDECLCVLELDKWLNSPTS